MNKKLVYLATPYSHSSKDIMEERVRVVNKVTAELLRNGLHIFSPISHTHAIAIDHQLPTDWEFWESHCRCILSACCMLIVLKQEGWESSVGVNAEVKIAQELGIPIDYIDPI